MTIAEYYSFKALWAQGTFGEVTLGRAYCNQYDVEDAKLASEQDPLKAEKMIINQYLDW